MNFYEYTQIIWRAHVSVMLDIFCFAPYLVGWFVIVALTLVVMGVLETAGLTKEQSPAEKRASNWTSGFLAFLCIVTAAFAPIVAAAFIVAGWWCYFIYCIIEPPVPALKYTNYVTVVVLSIYTALVLGGLVHKRPQFLFSIEWSPLKMEGIAERVEQNFPLSSDELKAYLRSESSSERLNAIWLVYRRPPGKITDPEILEILFDRFEHETHRLAHELSMTILYNQYTGGYLSPKQTERLGRLKKAGAAERFSEPEEV